MFYSPPLKSAQAELLLDEWETTTPVHPATYARVLVVNDDGANRAKVGTEWKEVDITASLRLADILKQQPPMVIEGMSLELQMWWRDHQASEGREKAA